MIVAFSTSSQVASVALFDEGGGLLGGSQEEAHHNASWICLKLLSELAGGALDGVTGFLSDLGPGSFTGVKVGVTLAKTMAMARGVRAGGVSAFDLISPNGLVVIPSKKGEFFWRESSGSVSIHPGLPPSECRGFGTGIIDPEYPLASGFAAAWSIVRWTTPELLLPEYQLEPSISTPNRPYGAARG